MQEVNLLSEELKPQHDPFTLREFGIAWVLLVAMLTSLTAWEGYESWSIGKTIATNKTRLAGLTAEVGALQSNPIPAADASLTQQLASLSDERSEQRKLAAVLKKEPINHGFQGHLTDLASVDMRKLWFDSIQLEQGGQKIRLAGYSETAELIPLYLSMLSQGSSFSGYSFDGLKIKRESDALVSFEVHGPLSESHL